MLHEVSPSEYNYTTVYTALANLHVHPDGNNAASSAENSQHLNSAMVVFVPQIHFIVHCQITYYIRYVTVLICKYHMNRIR